jgi:tight adherence protein B
VTLPGWVPYAVAGVIFLGLGSVVLTLAWPGSSNRQRIKQIDHFGPGRVPTAQRDASAGSVLARTALAATASVVRSGRMEQRIALRLARAGMTIKPHEWVLLQVCVVVALAALLYVVADWPGAVMGALIGWLLTLLYRMVKTERRANQFAEQLPDALQLVIGSLKAGFSLPQALDALVREAPDPVAAEIGRATAEHRLGADVSDALERVAVRARSEDLGWAVMAVRIQREVGGNLAEVLQTTVDTMRERARLRRHVRALSAEGRISAWILIGLPIALGAFMFMFRREYLTPLFTERLGQLMVIGGGLLFVLGIVWMTRVIRVES